MKIFNAFHLKLIMAFLMLLDHIEYIPGFLPPDAAYAFTIASRCVAPVFAFLVVEGVFHTSDLKKYCVRLFAFAAVMFAGNMLINFIFDAYALPAAGGTNALHPDNNIMITLAFGALGLALIKWGKEQRKRVYFILSALCLLPGIFYFEWGAVVIPLMLLTYFFKNQNGNEPPQKSLRNSLPFLLFLGYVIIEILALLLPWGEPFWFIALPFIWMYNGERGPKTAFSKYFFYIFYPAHLWLIAMINFFLSVR